MFHPGYENFKLWDKASDFLKINIPQKDDVFCVAFNNYKISLQMSHNPHNSLLLFPFYEWEIYSWETGIDFFRVIQNMRQSQYSNLYMSYNKLICVMSAWIKQGQIMKSKGNVIT